MKQLSIQTVGCMRESSDSINGILLENIDKEIPINFSLLTTPVRATRSISKHAPSLNL